MECKAVQDQVAPGALHVLAAVGGALRLVAGRERHHVITYSPWYSRYHLAKTGMPSFIVVVGS